MSEDIAVQEDDVVQFSLWSRLYGQECRNEFGYWFDYNEDVDLLAGLCPFFEALKLPVIRALCTQDVLFYNIRADVWRPAGTAYESIGWRDYPMNVQGSVSGAGSALPPNNALIMRRRVGPAGRANRGRVYLPGVPTSWQQGGIFAGSAFIDAVNSFKVEMARALTNEETPAIPLAQPALLKKGPTGMVTDYLVVSYWDVNYAVRSQRRREPGVGI